MRLIDADALKKEFPKDTDWEYPVNTNEYVCEKIDEQPTIEERKKGEWIKVDPHIVVCPFCKKASSPKNFCADCGADLRSNDDD